MNLTETWQYDRLRQRRDWLDARQKAKASVGWDNQYDCEERDALTWVLERLAGMNEEHGKRMSGVPMRDVIGYLSGRR